MNLSRDLIDFRDASYRSDCDCSAYKQRYGNFSTACLKPDLWT